MLAQQPVHEGGLSLGPINISALKTQSRLLCAPLPSTSGTFIPERELKQSHWLLSRLMSFQSLMKRPERSCKTCLQTTPAEQHICLGSSSSHQPAFVFYESPSLLPPFFSPLFSPSLFPPKEKGNMKVMSFLLFCFCQNTTTTSLPSCPSLCFSPLFLRLVLVSNMRTAAAAAGYVS